METYKDFEEHNGLVSYKSRMDGAQWIFSFANGYGASVITGGIAYCNEGQPYELAVLKDNDLCYDTPITDDVIGYLTSNEVYELLNRIESL